ncbi:hypothetical protein NPIL_524031 [Nephila pilipes]|uniref:Uncharacterized protein n=1 Tax=Nephila pilipes TaxID=299642 RepID=A0A8X6NWS0_NEPPI|nr:hypothetical protein NPIL_524031 [Nephila pilipes]
MASTNVQPTLIQMEILPSLTEELMDKTARSILDKISHLISIPTLETSEVSPEVFHSAKTFHFLEEDVKDV